MCTINAIIYINAVILCKNFGKMNHPTKQSAILTLDCTTHFLHDNLHAHANFV